MKTSTFADQPDQPDHQALTPLTRRVLNYQRTGVGKSELLEELSLRCYDYPRRKLYGFEPDDAGEFLLRSIGRLGRLLDLFQYRGVPFEHYINSVLSWQLHSYARSRHRARLAWETARDPNAWDGRLPAAARTIGLEDLEAVWTTIEQRSRRPESAKRRYLVFLLKAHRVLDCAVVEAACRRAGLDEERVARLIERAGEHRHEHRVRKLTERRNHAYWLALEATNAFGASPDPNDQAIARARHATASRTASQARSDLARARTTPSNARIAELTGMPKGTVDGIMRWLQQIEPGAILRRDAPSVRHREPSQGE